jgi:hypothetical protein
VIATTAGSAAASSPRVSANTRLRRCMASNPASLWKRTGPEVPPATPSRQPWPVSRPPPPATGPEVEAAV